MNRKHSEEKKTTRDPQFIPVHQNTCVQYQFSVSFVTEKGQKKLVVQEDKSWLVGQKKTSKSSTSTLLLK